MWYSLAFQSLDLAICHNSQWGIVKEFFFNLLKRNSISKTSFSFCFNDFQLPTWRKGIQKNIRKIKIYSVHEGEHMHNF